jgi:hypothetical protein
VPRPWLTGRVSAAVLVRKTDAERPTLLLDESDAALKVDSDYSEALRGLLNTGYRRSGKASLCIGQGANLSYRDFSTFGAKAIAGIGALPDTVADRAIPITLRRRAASETVARWRNREGRQEAATLATALAAWGRSALESLRQARPALPDALSDRAGDCWEPLLAIADLMGGEWPQRARQAAVALMGAVEDSDPGIELLKDLHEILAESDDETIPTTDLIEKLTALEDRPWATWNHGRSMTPNALARQLKRFGILPAGKVRLSPQKVARSYRRALFEDAFARYLPFKAEQRNKPNENGPELPLSKWNNDPSCSAFKTEISPINTGLCSTVPLSTPDMSTREHSDDADGEYYNG